MPANFNELVEIVKEAEKDWTKRDMKIAVINAEFGDVILYGPNYSRVVWEHVYDYICTDDNYWLQKAKDAKKRILERRSKV